MLTRGIMLSKGPIRRRMLPMVGVVVIAATSMFLAHYVWGQVSYIHGQLTPKGTAIKPAPEWTADEPGLRPLREQAAEINAGDFRQARN